MNTHYDKLFSPYQRGKYTLDKVMEWLKTASKAEQQIIDQVVANTMTQLAAGEDFSGKCACGCDFEPDQYPDARISHYMLAQVLELKNAVASSRLKVLQDHQNAITEARNKQLVNSEKQMYTVMHGTWTQRHLPTLRRWVGLKD